MTEKGRLVYSTDSGKQRAREERGTQPASNEKTGFVYLSRDRKGRGGKTVTVISGLPLGENERKALLKRLKSTCGAGGAVKGTDLELQGDHRERLKPLLEKQGYKVKMKGG